MLPVSTDIAIVGAGTAGCMLAAELQAAGRDCVLIEKSRGMGGRCSKRYLAGNISIDLGAPDFEIEKALPGDYLATWLEQGCLTRWTKTVATFDAPHKTESKTTLCATPSLNSWHRKIARHTQLLTRCRVNKLVRNHNRWNLFDDEHQHIMRANTVVITAPAEQACRLLKSVDELTSDHCDINFIDGIESLPQYVCALGFASPLNLSAEVYQGNHTILQAAIRESSKPGRECPQGISEIWVLHSGHRWAEQQVSNSAATVLTDTFCSLFQITDQPELLTSHYWRLAHHQSHTPLRDPFLWNHSLQIGCCGDWLDGNDIQGALRSAFHLSQHIMGR